MTKILSRTTQTTITATGALANSDKDQSAPTLWRSIDLIPYLLCVWNRGLRQRTQKIKDDSYQRNEKNQKAPTRKPPIRRGRA